VRQLIDMFLEVFFCLLRTYHWSNIYY